MRDPYSLLGVKRTANADEIKAAWRSKAKSIHPDHNQDDPDAGNRFAEVGQAYEVLKDPAKRKRYDKASDMQQTYQQQRESARSEAERARAARARAEAVMEELARAKAQAAQAAQNQGTESKPEAKSARTERTAKATKAEAKAGGASGRDQASRAETSKAEATAGETPEDMIERIFGVSPNAGTSGSTDNKGEADTVGAGAAQSASDPHGAPAAEARPLPVMAVDLLASLMRRIRGTAPPPEKAPNLAAEATVTIKDLLDQNSITLHLGDEREVRVHLKAGMTEGKILRLKGEGVKIAGVKPGDLMVTLKVARDPQFHVEGYDIHTILPISLEDAVLGTETKVATPQGEHDITVPAWSGSDRVIRMEGLGLPNDTGGRGDLVAEVRIVLLDKPDPKVTDLMRHMRHGLYL